MKIGRISKIAGIGFAGFVVAAIAADKVNLGPALSQMAGVLGGFVGTLVGRRNVSGGARTPKADRAAKS